MEQVAEREPVCEPGLGEGQASTYGRRGEAEVRSGGRSDVDRSGAGEIDRGRVLDVIDDDGRVVVAFPRELAELRHQPCGLVNVVAGAADGGGEDGARRKVRGPPAKVADGVHVQVLLDGLRVRCSDGTERLDTGSGDRAQVIRSVVGQQLARDRAHCRQPACRLPGCGGNLRRGREEPRRGKVEDAVDHQVGQSSLTGRRDAEQGGRRLAQRSEWVETAAA